MPWGDLIVGILEGVAEGGTLFLNIFRFPGTLLLRVLRRGSNFKHIWRQGNVLDQFILGLLVYAVLALFIIWLVA